MVFGYGFRWRLRVAECARRARKKKFISTVGLAGIGSDGTQGVEDKWPSAFWVAQGCMRLPTEITGHEKARRDTKNEKNRCAKVREGSATVELAWIGVHSDAFGCS